MHALNLDCVGCKCQINSRKMLKKQVAQEALSDTGDQKEADNLGRVKPNNKEA